MAEHILMSIDPGVKHLGVAFFVFGKLFYAKLSTGLGGQPDTLLEPIPELVELLCEMKGAGLGGIDCAVVEEPQIYDTKGQRGDQDDLIKLAVTTGAVCATLAYRAPMPIRGILRIKPRDWKGQVPKPVMNDRTMARLDDKELKMVDLPSAESMQHNVKDAIGIGLWRIGRLGK